MQIACVNMQDIKKCHKLTLPEDVPRGARGGVEIGG
jgi:hypothetical protein